MTKKPTVQNEDKYVIRFPDGMRDALKAAAEANGRSMNAEILARIEDHPKIASLERTVLGLGQEHRKLQEQLESSKAELAATTTERVALEAERLRIQAERAVLLETKESIEREARHLTELRDHIESQIPVLQHLQAEMSEEKLALNGMQSDLIEEQSKVIDHLREGLEQAKRFVRSFKLAIDAAARGDTRLIDHLIGKVRDEYHYEELLSQESKPHQDDQD